MPQAADEAKVENTANNEKQCNQVLRELSLSGDCATGWKCSLMQTNVKRSQGGGQGNIPKRENRLHGTVMQRTDQERGLGVFVEKSLKPPAQ